MGNKLFFFVLFFCLAPVSAFAQSLVGPVYPESVRFSPDKPGYFLSKDSYDQVKSFYAKDSGGTTREREVDGFRTVFFEYMSVLEVQKYDPVGSAIGVQIFEGPFHPSSPVDETLGNLKGLNMQGSLSEAEYKRLVQEYKPVVWWFFPLSEKPDGNGKYWPLDEVIFEQCETGSAENTMQQDAEAMGKRVEELMAQGKHQEAMQLMQQLGQSVHQYTETNIRGPGAVEKWTTCLRELKKNGYRTRIEIAVHPASTQP